MSLGIDTRTIIAEMEVGFLEPPPIRFSSLTQEWAFRSSAENELAALRSFLGQVVTRYQDDVGAMRIVQTLRPVLNSFLRDSIDVTARDIIKEVSPQFSTEAPDTGEVSEAVGNAFDGIRVTREERATISRALVMVRAASDVLETLTNVVTKFVSDPEVAPKAFKTAVDRERLAKLVLADVETDRQYLSSLLRSLAGVADDQAKSREELLRALSAMNGFIKLREQDKVAGHIQTRGPVSRPALGGSAVGVFAAGDVKLRHDSQLPQ